MKTDTFNLRPSDEFIELSKLIKIKDLAQSGGHAKIIINSGLVKVNGEQELRKRRKLKKGDVIEFEDSSIEII